MADPIHPERRRVYFFNLVIKFGERDLLEEGDLVMSAFTNDTHIRTRRAASFHFIDQRVFGADVPYATVFVAGRFVKDTILRREQVLEGENLRSDPRNMRSSPSAFFVLDLRTHRLIFMPETRYPPKAAEFVRTVEEFLVNQIRARAEKFPERPRITRPHVSLVPLVEIGKVAGQVNRFSKIRRLTLEIAPRNSEFNAGDALEKVSRALAPTEPERLYTVAVAPSGESLDHQAVAEVIAETAEKGYEDATLEGLDEQGGKLMISNDDYKMSREIRMGYSQPLRIARLLADELAQEVVNGNIKVSDRLFSRELDERIAAIRQSLPRDG